MAIELFDKTKSLKYLNAQERALIMLFVIVGVGCASFALFFKPIQQKMTDLKKEESELNEQTQQMLIQLPDLDSLKNEMEQFKAKISDIELKNKIVEAKLLSEAQLTQFLTELIKCADGLLIDFQSFKQNVEPDKPGFSRLILEIIFEARYEEMLNYIHRVEQISPYVKLEDMKISQAKTDPRTLVSANLRLNAILASHLDAQSTLSAVCSQNAIDRLIVARNPLTPSIKTLGKKIRNLKLLGITYNPLGVESSAIINDSVVKVGDEIEGQKVQQIMADSVVLNDGLEDYTLIVER